MGEIVCSPTVQGEGRRRRVHVLHGCTCLVYACARVCMYWKGMSMEWFSLKLNTGTQKFQSCFHFHLFPFGEARKDVKYDQCEEK